MKFSIFAIAAAAAAAVATLVQGYQTGLDVSALTSTSSFSCAKNLGYDHVIARCYMEAYGNNPVKPTSNSKEDGNEITKKGYTQGGKVDPNCYSNYKNAKAAGFTSVDIYMFPCTGRSTCKSPATQVQEIVDYVGAHKMIVGTLWLDVEVDSAANNWPSTSEARSSKFPRPELSIYLSIYQLYEPFVITHGAHR